MKEMKLCFHINKGRAKDCYYTRGIIGLIPRKSQCQDLHSFLLVFFSLPVETLIDLREFETSLVCIERSMLAGAT